MKLDWNQFKVKNPDSRDAFQSLCYHLFCRRFKITDGIFEHKNQVGIETEPIKVERDVIGFQSKYFDIGIDKQQIVKSIEKAKNKNPKLTKIIFYINQTFSEGKKNKESATKNDIETCALKNKIQLEWVVPSNFQMLLSQPCNNDLAQVYFSVGDEYGFIQSCCDPIKMTLLNSEEYLNIPFIDDLNNVKKDVKRSMISSKEKVWLLVGHPGSGKSIYMHKLFQQFGGLDKTSSKSMREVINKTRALPMLINLKDCNSDSLENVVRNRQSDYKLRNNRLSIIYLLDGLDELDQEKADKVLTYMVRLANANNTKKLIISCRSGNKNRLKTKVYFPELKEYKISDLGTSHIQQYFKGKGSPAKNQLLKKIEKLNPNLVNKITDILFVKLLWDTISKLNERSNIFDLLEQKVSALLNSPYHKKNIDDLNLLDPKQNIIYELNKDISYEFFKKYQFRFPEKEIQDLILNKFPRIDYKSTNFLLNYLIDMFFDADTSSDINQQTYIYHHRRYQEYFSAHKLKDEYERDPQQLRNVRVLSNQEFFNQLFLPFLKREYLKSNNLCRLIELNLVDVYLGQHRGWGADDPYYLNSSEFIPSLATQKDSLFQQLLDDDTLQIKEKLLVDISELESKFEAWEKDKSNYRNKDFIKNSWESGVATLIENAVIFWRHKKFSLAKELLKNIDDIRVLFDKHNFFKNLQDHDHIRDPFWEKFESWLFILIVIKRSDIETIFDKLIRKNYSKFSDTKDYTPDGSAKGKLIKSYFRVCLRQNKKIATLFENCDTNEKNIFLTILASEEFLPLFLRNKRLRKIIKIHLKTQEFSEEHYHLLFYKRVLEVPLSEVEVEFAKNQLIELQKERSIDWRLYNTHLKYALLSYVGSVYDFEKLREDIKTDTLRYYNELQLYAALFNGFIQMIDGKASIDDLLREYLFYVETHDDRFRLYLQVSNSFLWAYIIKYSNESIEKLIAIKQRLLRDESKIISFSLLYKLSYISMELFIKLVNEYEITKFETETKKWNDDFPSLIDRYLGLAVFYSGINQKKAEEYIAKAINDGVLRHGWRKDSIVSYHLVEALEILWKNNWIPKEIVSKYAEDVFALALRVADITDGKGTWQGPYNVIELVSNYDIELAEMFKKKLVDKEGRYNIGNWAITAVIMGKIKLGLPHEIIEEDMKGYSIRYDYENKPQADYYEQKFKVYLALAQSQLYTAKARESFFNKAYEQIEEMKSKSVNYYLRDSDFQQEKSTFVKLCKQYDKKINVTFENKEQEYKKKPKMSEKQFISAINKVNNRRRLQGLYKKLGNYNNGIVLQDEKSWRVLVNKTFDVMGSIKLFTDLLEKNMYPHTDFMTSNSKYFQFGLAEALNNINTKEDTLKYLYEHSGHGGFLNIMKAYEINRDRDMCIKLFKHFLNFCKFLVY